jgi:MYXO-CTERM domain-containing protein
MRRRILNALGGCALAVALVGFAPNAEATLSIQGAPFINVEAVDIDPPTSGNHDINNTTEAEAIYAAWVAAGKPASGPIAGYTVGASGSAMHTSTDWGGAGHDFSPTNPYPGAPAVGGNDFLVRAAWAMWLPAGDYTIHVESDDGFSLVLNGVTFSSKFGNGQGGGGQGSSNELRFEAPTGNSNTGGQFTLAADTFISATGIFFERGGGDYFEIAIDDSLTTSTGPGPYSIIRNGLVLHDQEIIVGKRIVPEPATAMLGVFGLGALAMRRRRQS